MLHGVPELLDALQGQAALGLASGNMARGAQAKLDQFGLWDRFRGGGFGDHVEARHELVVAAIHDVAQQHGIEPDPRNTVVIGDTQRDVAAGQHAGARVLGVATGRSSVDELLESGAEMAIEDFGDTQRAVDLLLG
ncbi:MAG: HAD hydrolase-like protein [Dehalococcoidia bacterium]|nr:HAD hydrolase-like protein [Dehalococcoidia bacterium]